jgi:nucleoside recognition membrane protein YjiH
MIEQPRSKLSDPNHARLLSPYSAKQLAKFIIPTLFGILLFLTPISVDGRLTVMIAFVIDYINTVIKPLMVPVTVFIAVVPSLITVLVTFSPLKYHSNRFIQLFNPGLGWTTVGLSGPS